MTYLEELHVLRNFKSKIFLECYFSSFSTLAPLVTLSRFSNKMTYFLHVVVKSGGKEDEKLAVFRMGLLLRRELLGTRRLTFFTILQNAVQMTCM